MNPILIVEDDEMLNSGLCYNLMLEGYETQSALNITEAKEKSKKNKWALLLLDVNLPDGSGFEFAQWVREQSDVPLIFLTGNDLEDDMLKGFDVGADDYITKPFNIKIVLKKIKVLLSRASAQSEKRRRYEVGNLSVDFDSQDVTKSGKPISLTPTEYKLLTKFCNNPGIVLTRDVLLEDLWDKDGNFVDEHTLTINISRLRSKISDHEFKYIETVYGTGYRWVGDKHE